jgi:hypothetical protein
MPFPFESNTNVEVVSFPFRSGTKVRRGGLLLSSSKRALILAQ